MRRNSGNGDQMANECVQVSPALSTVLGVSGVSNAGGSVMGDDRRLRDRNSLEFVRSVVFSLVSTKSADERVDVQRMNAPSDSRTLNPIWWTPI